MIALAWWSSAALAGGLLQVGTGARPLQAPGTGILVGGGLRLGPSLGPVTPFVGGTVLRATSKQRYFDGNGIQWSAQGGFRVDLAGLARPAQPFLALGALYGSTTGHAVGADSGLVWADTGPGGFAGLGADAVLLPGMRVGIEFGGAGARGDIQYFESGNSSRPPTARLKGTVLWSYADLHLTFRGGVAK
jgi:hypothetical protein